MCPQAEQKHLQHFNYMWQEKKNLILTEVHWPKIWSPDSQQIGIAASTVLHVTMKNGVSEVVIQAVWRNNISVLLTEFQTAEIKDVNILK